jgi:DNA primase
VSPNELKKYIIDNDLAEKTLRDIGCTKINANDKEIRCARPNHTNSTSLALNKETLKVTIYSENWHGDIYALVMKYKNLTFGQCMKYLHKLYGLKYSYNGKVIKDEVKNPLDIFTKVKKQRYQNIQLEEVDDNVLLNSFPYLHISLVKEGVAEFTREEFNIGYDYYRQAIIIPHYKYDDGKLVGVMRRTTIENYELFDIPKYFPIKAYPKGNNLYGLYNNYYGIQTNGYVTVHEAEKSVWKRHSRFDFTGVSLGCHSISNEQAKILIGLNVDVIISFDKDVSLLDIYKACEQFYNIRNVFYLYDKNNALQDHMAPADLCDNDYKAMFNQRIKYDESKHLHYLKLLEERGA